MDGTCAAFSGKSWAQCGDSVKAVQEASIQCGPGTEPVAESVGGTGSTGNAEFFRYSCRPVTQDLAGDPGTDSKDPCVRYPDLCVKADYEKEGEGSDAEDDAESILEDRLSDATLSEVADFIAGLNEDEKAHLVALAWVGRGTYSADEFLEAVATAKAEQTTPTEQYLLGIPLLADFLEEGLEQLGYSVEDSEEGVL